MIDSVRSQPAWPPLVPIEWIGLLGRWPPLIALVFVAGATGKLPSPAGWVLSVWCALALAWPALRLIGVLKTRPAIAASLADLGLALAVVHLSGDARSPLLGGVLIAVMEMGLTHGLPGAAGSSILAGAFGGWLAVLGSPGDALWLGPIVYGSMVVAAGLVVGGFSNRVRREALALADRQVLERSKRWTGERRQRGRNAYRLAAELNSTLNFDQVVELAMDLSGRSIAEGGGEEERLTRALLLVRNGHLTVASGRRLTQAERRETVALEGSLMAEVLSSGEPRLSHEPMSDPALYRLHSLRSARAVLCVPVASGLVAHGVMVFAHAREDFFTAEKVDTLQAISQQTAIALQNATLYRDLAQEKQRFTEIQEEARKKLARDLHDGPTQALATIAMRLNFARRLLDKDRAAAVEELGKVEDLARRTTKDVRHMLFTLRPLILESQGLVAALQQLGEKVGDTHHQKVILESEPDAADEIELPRQAVIFYIAEEAINNARKHARAEHIWVRLAIHGDLFVLEVQDDGVGFNVGAVDASYVQRGSLGMVNMRERTQMINGHLRVVSAEGKGTRITMTVPVHDRMVQTEAEEGAPKPVDTTAG